MRKRKTGYGASAVEASPRKSRLDIEVARTLPAKERVVVAINLEVANINCSARKRQFENTKGALDATGNRLTTNARTPTNCN